MAVPLVRAAVAVAHSLDPNYTVMPRLSIIVPALNEAACILDILGQLQNVPNDYVLLMPQAQTRQQHRQLAPQVATMCLERGFRYGPRLHIELWDNQRQK